MNTYTVKMRVAVYYEVEATIKANSAVEAMDETEKRFYNNTLPPLIEVGNSGAAIVSVKIKT